MKIPLSVLVPVKNEESEILECLESVSWADEIVVADSLSTDRTCELAQSHGATVVQFEYRPGGPKKKNWMLDNFPFKNEWILIIDADERITHQLRAEIESVLAAPGDKVGFFLNRRFFFLGKWIKHCGYYPSWNLRLLRKNFGNYEKIPDLGCGTGDNEVHEHVILQGPAGYLIEPMDHFAYRSVGQFVSKHNRYSSWEASVGSQSYAPILGEGEKNRVLNLRRRAKRWGRALPFPHWIRFVYHFFFSLGFLDGKAGYVFCHLLSEYEFLIWVKSAEVSELKQINN